MAVDKALARWEEPQSIGIVRPLVTVDAAVAAFNEYQQLKQKLRGPGDFITFTDRNGQQKEAPTKQWRSKLTRFFGISCEIVKEEIETLPDGSFVVKVTAKATAPNGLYMYGDGSCWSKTKEGRGDLYHNTRSHAVTRAKNRAVLELVGFGEVSAEEITDVDYEEERPKATEPKAERKARSQREGNGEHKGGRDQKWWAKYFQSYVNAGIAKDIEDAHRVAREAAGLEEGESLDDLSDRELNQLLMLAIQNAKAKGQVA
jgi:hypothetical protein